MEDRDAVLPALDGYDWGLDFADALHLARSARASAFLTFDRGLAHRAKALTGTIPVVYPWLGGASGTASFGGINTLGIRCRFVNDLLAKWFLTGMV